VVASVFVLVCNWSEVEAKATFKLLVAKDVRNY